jgi:hypothetical protein
MAPSSCRTVSKAADTACSSLTSQPALLYGQRRVLDRLTRVDVFDVPAPQDRGRRPYAGLIRADPVRALSPEHEVLCHRQLGNQGELLECRRHVPARRGGRTAEADRDAVDLQSARVGPDQARAARCPCSTSGLQKGKKSGGISDPTNRFAP